MLSVDYLHFTYFILYTIKQFVFKITLFVIVFLGTTTKIHPGIHRPVFFLSGTFLKVNFPFSGSSLGKSSVQCLIIESKEEELGS